MDPKDSVIMRLACNLFKVNSCDQSNSCFMAATSCDWANACDWAYSSYQVSSCEHTYSCNRANPCDLCIGLIHVTGFINMTSPKGYKTFFMLSSAESKIYPAHKC